jgi:1,4-dihydroxy-2-naphthoate octaprenyltransferase
MIYSRGRRYTLYNRLSDHMTGKLFQLLLMAGYIAPFLVLFKRLQELSLVRIIRRVTLYLDAGHLSAVIYYTYCRAAPL